MRVVSSSSRQFKLERTSSGGWRPSPPRSAPLPHAAPHPSLVGRRGGRREGGGRQRACAVPPLSAPPRGPSHMPCHAPRARALRPRMPHVCRPVALCRTRPLQQALDEDERVDRALRLHLARLEHVTATHRRARAATQRTTTAKRCLMCDHADHSYARTTEVARGDGSATCKRSHMAAARRGRGRLSSSSSSSAPSCGAKAPRRLLHCPLPPAPPRLQLT